MNEMLIGAITACCLIIGLFFLRFWKATGDKFFLFFAISFLIESANRALLYFFFDLRETSPTYYLIRLLAYGFIIFAIFKKNKKRNSEKEIR